MKHLIWILPAMLLAACAGMTAEQATTATVASVPIVVAMLDNWLNAGIISPEQHAEAMAVFQQMGASFQSIMSLIQIWGGNVNELREQVQTQQSHAVSTEVAIGGGITLTGVALAAAKKMAASEAEKVDMRRDLRRAQREEPLG